MIEVALLSDEEKRLLLKQLLPNAVKLLSEDDATASHHTEVEFDLESLIPDIGDEYQQYFGEVVTVHKNRQGTKGHPKSFLCYITIPEAKLLRSLGLGYSLNPDTCKWEQHLSKDGIPSFQGGDGGGGDGGGGDGGGGSGSHGGNGGGWGGSGDASDGGLGGLGGAATGDDGADRGGSDGFGGSDTSDEGGFLSGIANSISSALSGISNSISGLLGGYSDPTADNNYGGFSIDNGTYSTTMSISRTEMGTTYNFNPAGFMNDSVSYAGVDGTSVSGGAIASNLSTAFGWSGATSISVSSLGQAALSIALGAPIGALAPTAKAMEAQGLIGSDLSKGLQAAGLIGQFMGGIISSVQAYGAISQAKSMGAINNMQAAVLGAVTAYSTYNSFTAMQQGLSSLGFSVNGVEMSEFGFSVVGDSLYHNGILVTTTNFNTITLSYINYLVGKNAYSYQDPEFDTFEKMAGGILLNNYLAGGTMWNPMNLVHGNYNNAVGISNSFSTFTQMSMLQNDYVGTVLAKNPS